MRARRPPVGGRSGCTTSSSTSAARRSRSRRATRSCSTTLVERGIEPLAFRYFFLQAHYRQQQAFSFDECGPPAPRFAGSSAHGRRGARRGGGEPARRRIRRAIEPLRARFWAALRDDLNAPRALAVAWEVARDELSPADQWSLLADFDRVLGFGLSEAAIPTADDVSCATRASTRWSPSAGRRAARDFASADRIRDELAPNRPRDRRHARRTAGPPPLTDGRGVRSGGRVRAWG